MITKCISGRLPAITRPVDEPDEASSTGQVMSGNTSDMTFNNGWIKTVRKALQKSEDDFLLYTADSAAVTEDNLMLFKEYRVDMISRLPERYTLAEELINQAISLDKRKLNALDSKVEKEKRELEKITEGITKREFFCEKDAKIEIEKFYKENKPQLHELTSSIIEVERTVKREKRGRPKAGEVPLLEKKYFVKHSRQQRIQFGAGLCLEAPERFHFGLKSVKVGDDAALFGKGREGN